MWLHLPEQLIDLVIKGKFYEKATFWQVLLKASVSYVKVNMASGEKLE